MKKLFLALVMALMFVAPVFAEEAAIEVQKSDEEFDYVIGLDQGWNLIPYGKGLYIEFDDKFEKNLKAAYVYDSDEKTYYDLLKDDDPIFELVNERGYIAIWVYMDYEGEQTESIVEVQVDSEIIYETLRDTKFKFTPGWNFYVLLPQMQKAYPGPHYNIHVNQYGESVMRNMYIWDNDWEKVTKGFIEWENDNGKSEEIIPLLIYYDDYFTPEFDTEPTPIVPAFPEN